MKIEFNWVNETEAPDEYVWETETTMTNFMRRFDRASELMFHTIHLTNDPEGPIVMAYGKDGDDATVHLHYIEKALA